MRLSFHSHVNSKEGKVEQVHLPTEAGYKKWLKTVYLITIIYLFLFSIFLLGHAFKLLGADVAQKLLTSTSNPFLGLFLGLVATSIVQSSGMTTSTIIGLVAAGGLTTRTAIPMIMGANIGTTVTNIFVSFGHATRRLEFKRAFSAAVIHDIFNVLSVCVLFPLELNFHMIEKLAHYLEKIFENVGGLALFNPLKYIIDPVVHAFSSLFMNLPSPGVVLGIIALVTLFIALAQMVIIIRSMVMGKFEKFLDQYLFRNDLSSFLLGLVLTATVHSSSVATSLIVPLAGAGMLTIPQIYPYTLGANIGTTFTAIIAALATGNGIAVTTAFCHTLFNTFGICIFYPLRIIPITLASRIGEYIGKANRNVWIVIGCFLTIYIIPILFFILR